MAQFAITHRPFSSELITGLALPDGIFETTLGPQNINVHLSNAVGFAVAGAVVFIESVSHPGIVVTPRTHTLGSIAAGATRLLSWRADFAAAPPGVHRVSFVVKHGATTTRIIKKIFVTRVSFDASTGGFSAEFPEGRLGVVFTKFVGPKDGGCCGGDKKERNHGDYDPKRGLLSYLRQHGGQRDPDFKLCLPGYLPSAYKMTYTPTPGYDGQYSDLPFQDPWHKVILVRILVLLLIASAVAEATSGTGSVGVSVGGGGGGGPTDPGCCGVTASGGGSSYLAAGLLAAAAAVAAIACLTDARDPFRRGQDNTLPAPGETTLAESVDVKVTYVEPVALGRPFALDVNWRYQRMTDGRNYEYEVSERQNNIHVLTKYEINAPDVVATYRKDLFRVRARFWDGANKLLRGGALFVQCFLVGPAGQFIQFPLEDAGAGVDAKPNDGTYSGMFDFSRTVIADPSARGIWTYYVIAQDMNQATVDMTPEQAAQYIGGLVVTHQLVIDFEGGTCPFVPDGHVNVI